MTEQELLNLTPGELTDLGICPTCLNRKHNGDEEKFNSVKKQIGEYSKEHL